MEGNNLIWILLAVNAIGISSIIVFFGYLWYSAKRNTEKIEEHEVRFEKVEKRVDTAEAVRHQDNERFTQTVSNINNTLTKLDVTMQNLADKINFGGNRRKTDM